MLLIFELLLVLFVRNLYLTLKQEALIRQKHLIYHNETSLQHLSRNKLNTEYFTCDKLMDIFSIYICGFAP